MSITSPDKPNGHGAQTVGFSSLTREQAKRAIWGGLRLAWLDMKGKFEARTGRVPRAADEPGGRVIDLRRGPPPTATPLSSLFRRGTTFPPPERILEIIEEQERAEANNPRNPKVPTPFPVDD